MESPYKDKPVSEWLEITKELVKSHPLSEKEIVEVVLSSWQNIFDSKIGKRGFKIGADIFPKPQIMGFLLHELIPLEFETRYPKLWRKEKTGSDKDLVHIPDDRFSVEIKTSSNPTSIFGNRSYAQEGNSAKKDKSAYYLTVNFGKFTEDIKTPPVIVKISFGWLDHSDWLGQKSQTGQQSRLSPDVQANKLLVLYRK